ncbi:MAG: class I SAM-dependent methyltransferase [Acidimicrobiales bacterium]|nr:class I SAM-dependent methyltransferase [Acidimicrobiales bacterium]
MDEPTPTPDYGESFADVYDDWYGEITDVGATADRVAALVVDAGTDRVLELGIGSGRLALPMAERGLRVVGIDSSPPMLDRLRAKSGADAIEVHEGDMAEADTLVDGPFGVVLIAFNTLFNLAGEDRQRACLTAVSSLLDPRGSLLVETAVWGDPPDRVERGLSTTRVDHDRVVLSATEHDPATQVVTGQHIDITADGTRLRPWRIRYLTPDQLDTMSAAAGLVLVERHADWTGAPLTAHDTVHVSRYQPTTTR